MTQEANTLEPLSLVGLNFVVGLSGTTLCEEETQLLSLLRPAGVILFAKNMNGSSITWPEEVIALLTDVRETCGREGLLVSIDHEGGAVHRFPNRVTHFAPAWNWSDLAYEVGAAMGRELRTLTMNLNFAPVLDVLSNPDNTVIGRRAFSDNPHRVAEAGKEFRRGLEAQGVIACGKHFPGHGGTRGDSHFELPVLDRSLEDLENLDLVPFRQLIEDGIQLLMTAHVLYPRLDPTSPATLSRIILHDLLRGSLGYTGAIISDALEMNALIRYSRAEAAVAALNAGVDLLLVGQPVGQGAIHEAVEMAQALLSALDSGVISESTLQESHKRVQRLLNYGRELRQRVRGGDCSTTLLGCDAHRDLTAKTKAREN